MEPLKVMLVTLMVLAEFAAITSATPTKDQLESKSLPSTTGLSHCPKTCGRTHISNIFRDLNWPYTGQYYPFGFGSGCSRPGFELICNNSVYLGTVYLGDNTTEIITGGLDGNIEVIQVKFKIHIINSTINNYNGSWNPGPPFTVYADDFFDSSFVVIGCGVDAYLLDGNNTEIGHCSTTCESENEIKRHEGVRCNGIGCCSISIDHRPSPIHFKINRNMENSELALKNVKAFMYSYTNDTFYTDYDGFTDQYIISQDDLDSIDTVRGMDFTSMALEWSIPSQSTCGKAKYNKTTYACGDNSKCTDNVNRKGYTCSCSQNYYGNAYIQNGCQDADSYSLPGPNCTRTHCGNIIVPFPFGLSRGCYGKESFQLECRNARLFSPITDIYELLPGAEYQVMEIFVNEGLLQVKILSQNNSYYVGFQYNYYYLNSQFANLSWVIDNITCQTAKQEKNNYACVSKHSECLDTNGTYWGNLGYRCRCNPGYQGNPYVANGCEDVDECKLKPPICNEKICNNTLGNYSCWACPSGKNYDRVEGKCIKVGRRPLLLGTIIGVISSIGVVLFTVGIIRARSIWKKEEKKRMRKKYFNKNEGILLQRLISSNESTSQKTKNFSLHELEIATNNFDRARISGQGAHGTVYKGILLDQRVVAIKRAKLVNTSEINQFINEVVLLSQIIHRNVVKLYGCCLETEVPLLVYEFISNGTLYSKLHDSPDETSSLTWGNRLRIAAEAAGALAYLHSAASISIFHRDLKSANILLDDNCTTKLSDFGASRCVLIDQKQVTTAVQGTFGYLDPEYYYTGQLSEKSDVYSFGVIIVELLTRLKPIFTNSLGEPVNLSSFFLQALRDGSYAALLDNEVLEDCTQEELTAMIGLVEMCLKLRGEERPTMKDVEMRLQFIQTSRKRQYQSAQTNEEGNQPEMAQLSHSCSLDTASWENQDTATMPSLTVSSWHQ